MLDGFGIRTAAALRDADRRTLRNRSGVTLARLADELSGIACLSLEEFAEPRRSIVCSRSFGEHAIDVGTLAAAVAGFAVQAAETLREQGSLTGGFRVFADTALRDDETPERHKISVWVSLPDPTEDSRELAAAAGAAIRREFRRGAAYRKAGVVLGDLIPAAGRNSRFSATPSGTQNRMRSCVRWIP